MYKKVGNNPGRFVMMSKFLIGFILVSFLVDRTVIAAENLSTLLESRGAEFLRQAAAPGTSDSRAVYLRFVEIVARELGKSGDRETAARLTNAISEPYAGMFPKTEFAWITHTFAREFYKDAIIKETGELIRFKTFATDVPNRMNPEFVKQKEYLHALATRLGLNFRDVGGYVQEIWIGEGKQSFGLMSHSDVQPVDPTEWSRDPWSGEVFDGKIWGRGSVDDKGPIVAIMYGMRAILDSGLPLNRKIILLVGTDEESANEDVTTYLQKNKAPDETIVVDSNFPVICAEKGWGGFWLTIPRRRSLPSSQGLLIVDLQSGFSPSIVPGKATTKLFSLGRPAAITVQEIQTTIDAFTKKRSKAQLSVEMVRDTIVLTAIGKSVHSSVPSTGHNALMDLLVFLDRHVMPIENDIALMAKFASTYIGLELNGKGLGIAHRDSFMGPLTVSGNMFQTTDTTVMFMFNLRIPRGMETERVAREVEQRMEDFGGRYGVRFSDRRYLGEPLYNDPETPFVQRLLAVYNSITKENRKAQSISGGTYAQRIPNSVVFGPALPEEEYLGHQPDEYFKISTLMRNIEILTNAMVEFGM